MQKDNLVPEWEIKKIYAALPALLLPWYRSCARPLPWRADREPYHVWLSEIMLQQTRSETVKAYYERFLLALPDLRSLADTTEDRLLKLWEGLGYYSRAKNLQKAARLILEEHGGIFPQDYDVLLKLPGIGPYTAGAIASICFEAPTPAVDGNVLRVIARVTEERAPIASLAVRRRIAESLRSVYPVGSCGDFTQCLMELGAVVCLPNGPPRCMYCPLSGLCLGYARGSALHLPVRGKKQARKIENRTVFFLRCGDRVAVRKRPPAGLLAGLWELPNVLGTLEEDAAIRQASAWGAAPAALQRTLTRKHIFTHVE